MGPEINDCTKYLERLLCYIKCSACKNIIFEPQTGVCKHDACAKCWASSFRCCPQCKVVSGVRGLRPNLKLSEKVSKITKLIENVNKFYGKKVISGGSSNNSNLINEETDKDSDECFIDRDNKYLNVKPYSKKKSPNKSNLQSISQVESPTRFAGESIDHNTIDQSKENINAERLNKVKGWLNNSKKFKPQTNSSDIEEVTDTSVSLNIDSQADLEGGKTKSMAPSKSLDVVKKKLRKHISESDESLNVKKSLKASKNVSPSKDNDLDEKENKNQWEPVKNMKRVLRKGKKAEIKKLSVSIETLSKVPSKVDILDSSTNYDHVDIIEDVFTLDINSAEKPNKSPDLIVDENKPSNTSSNIPVIDLVSSNTSLALDKDLLAYQEVLRQSKLSNQKLRRKSSSLSSEKSNENSSLNPVTHFSPSKSTSHLVVKKALERIENTCEESVSNKPLKSVQSSQSSFNKTPQVVSAILSDFDVPNEDLFTFSNTNFSSNPKFASKNISASKNPTVTENFRSDKIMNIKNTGIKKKNVPFIRCGKLYKFTNVKYSKKPDIVELFYRTISSANKWAQMPQDGLNIKIQKNNVCTSIIIRNEVRDANVVLTKTRDAQTSPISNIGNESPCQNKSINNSPTGLEENCPTNSKAIIENEDENPFVITETVAKEMINNDFPITEEEDIFAKFSGTPKESVEIPSTSQNNAKKDFKIHSHTKAISPISLKRLRNDKSLNNSSLEETYIGNTSKRIRTTSPDIKINDNIIVQFDSQTQASEENKNNVEENLNDYAFDSTFETQKSNADKNDKLHMLKKAIFLYKGDDRSESQNLNKAAENSPNQRVNTETDKTDQIESSDMFSENIPEQKKNEFEQINVVSSRENELCTPNDQMESEDVVEDTPQKERKSSLIKKSGRMSSASTHITPIKCNLNNSANKAVNPVMPVQKENTPQIVLERLSQKASTSSTKTLMMGKTTTPASLLKFTKNVKYQSTPLNRSAKRSLTYIDADNVSKISNNEEVLFSKSEIDDPTIINNDNFQSSPVCAKTLEREFIEGAFETSTEKIIHNNLNTRKTPQRKSVEKKPTISIEDSPSRHTRKKSQKISVTCTCLTMDQKKIVRAIAAKQGWTYKDKFDESITHLVVKVDQRNRCERTVKYVQALSVGCWILSFKWIMECHKTMSNIKEDAYIALDNSGERGPYMAKMSKIKLFTGMNFYLYPPFTAITVKDLKFILKNAGGEVVDDIDDIVINDPKKISILLGEAIETQEDRFMDICGMYKVIPVNIEWIFDSLGKGACDNVGEWLLANHSFLPKVDWPLDLIPDDMSD